jgi:parallel beta-helix repeat protein
MVAVAGLFVGGLASPAAADSDHTLYVSTHGSPTNKGHSCGTATFVSIQDAVHAAPAWGTVVVCPGTYAEDVTVGQPLTLVGKHATIDATGQRNAIWVSSSHVTVRGFTLENALGEGLLVGFPPPPPAAAPVAAPTAGPPPVLTHVMIDHVRATNNDRGFSTEKGCVFPLYDGDCGGGIHLEVTAWSTVEDSVVTGNADGILLTDDYGPNSHNTIEGNYVADNATECGIVLPSHNPGAVDVSTDSQGNFVLGTRNPTVGGVFDNVVRDNVVLRNGTAQAPLAFGGGGSGAGIGVFAPQAGTASYDNVIEDNYVAGNGMSGFTIHAHLPGGEDVSGNKVVDNTFGTNNTLGDGFDGNPTDFQTTAIAVYSGESPVEITIRDNEIRNNEIGIWLSTVVTAHGLSDNEFHHVTTQVVTG